MFKAVNNTGWDGSSLRADVAARFRRSEKASACHRERKRSWKLRRLEHPHRGNPFCGPAGPADYRGQLQAAAQLVDPGAVLGIGTVGVEAQSLHLAAVMRIVVAGERNAV